MASKAFVWLGENWKWVVAGVVVFGVVAAGTSIYNGEFVAE